MDDGRGSFLLVEAAGSGTVYGVRGVDDDRVVGSPSTDTAWEGNRWETALINIVPVGDPRTYMMAFPTTGGLRNCPVKGCPGWASMRTAVQVHFFTGIYGIPSSYWRRENSSTHGAPDVTCCFPGVH